MPPPYIPLSVTAPPRVFGRSNSILVEIIRAVSAPVGAEVRINGVLSLKQVTNAQGAKCG